MLAASEPSGETDVPIGDFNRPGVSLITVTGRPGSGPAALTVGIKLVCPNGYVHQLKPINFGDSAPDLDAVHARQRHVLPANGAWRVRAFDFSTDNGYIDAWSRAF
jgi:hypothetical protein